MKRLAVTLSLVAFACLSSPAYAQQFRYDFDKADRMQAEQEQRITQAIRFGKLTQREADRLRDRMREVASLEAQLRSSGGGLSWSERLQLTDKLEQTNDLIDRDINDGRSGGFFNFVGTKNIDAKEQYIIERINAGVKNGSLTNSEASLLRAKYDRINELEAKLRISGLNSRERDMLTGELNKLSLEVFTQMHDFETRPTANTRPWNPPTTGNNPGGGGFGGRWNFDFDSIDRTQRAQKQKIKDALRNRQISRNQFDRLNQRMTELAALEQQLRDSGARLSWRERLRVTDQLDALSHDIDQAIAQGPRHNRNSWVYGGGRFDNKQFDVRGRISDGQRDGSLSSTEAADLKAKYDRIADLEARLRTSGSGLDARERDRLTQELNTLSQQVFQQRHDRNGRTY